MSNKPLKQTVFLLIAFLFGFCSGLSGIPQVFLFADIVSSLFMSVLKLVGIPLVFLSIVSTLSSFKRLDAVLFLGRKVLMYTLLTTLVAAAVGLGLYLLLIHPMRHVLAENAYSGSDVGLTSRYLTFFSDAFPSNFIKPFLEGNIVSVFILAALVGISSLFVSDFEREFLHKLSTTLFSILLKIAKGSVSFLPVVIAAFSVLLARDLSSEKTVKGLVCYLICVLSANLIQGLIVLPLFLKIHQVSPIKTIRGMFPALVTAFFSKSSSATLPLTMELSEENLKIRPEISRFSFPLCSVINMNGCAAFILITVLYVCRENGIFISLPEMFLWVGISSLAAIGNAGVPMGCYFLSSALLSSMGVPLHLLGSILPFYAFLDMVETSLNVWSDCCITAMVDKFFSHHRLN